MIRDVEVPARIRRCLSYPGNGKGSWMGRWGEVMPKHQVRLLVVWPLTPHRFGRQRSARLASRNPRGLCGGIEPFDSSCSPSPLPLPPRSPRPPFNQPTNPPPTCLCSSIYSYHVVGRVILLVAAQCDGFGHDDAPRWCLDGARRRRLDDVSRRLVCSAPFEREPSAGDGGVAASIITITSSINDSTVLLVVSPTHHSD